MTRRALLILLFLPALARAELVVVMAKNAPVDSLTRAEVQQLFTGRSRVVAGEAVTPLDLPDDHPLRKAFYRQLLGKSPEQMQAYWSRMIFTGKGYPPRKVSGVTEMVVLVESAPDYIGYIDSSRLVKSLKVVYRLPQ